MLHDDARVLLGLWHVVACPVLPPRDKIAAKPHLPIVRVDVTVDGDDHEGAVEHVGVGGNPAVGRGQDHGLLAEVQSVPVVEHLLHAHVRRAGVSDLAGRDKSRNDLRVPSLGRPRRVAFGQLHHGDKLNTEEGSPGCGEPSWWTILVSLARCGHFRLEGEYLISAVDEDGVIRAELATYDAAAQGVLDVAPYGPRQRSSAELRVVALLGEELLDGVGDLDLDALAFEVLVQASEHYVHDLQHVLLGEGLEDDDLIYPVQELGPEGSLQGLARPSLGLAEVHAVAGGETELPRREEVLAAHVRGHDNDRVLEVDVAGGCADQARYRVSLLKLGHVEPDHGVLLAEEVFGERTRELGLADP